VQIPASSTEYVRVPVTGPVSLPGLVVELAVITSAADPVSADWKTAAWSGANTAILLVGPGSAVPLTVGVSYSVWVRVTSSPEIPVMRSGSLYAF
jgi:hypothetical protein